SGGKKRKPSSRRAGAGAARSVAGVVGADCLWGDATLARERGGGGGGPRHLRRGVGPAVRVAHDVVVHGPALGDEARVLDVAGDLRLRETEVRARRRYDVLLDHQAAEVVGAE